MRCLWVSNARKLKTLADFWLSIRDNFIVTLILLL